MAIGWYLRFSLSYRDGEELLVERGLDNDHVTVWHCVQKYAPELERQLRAHLKPTNKSWRVDEITFVSRESGPTFIGPWIRLEPRSTKRRVKASQGFRSFRGARRTIAGYEAVNRFERAKQDGSARVKSYGSYA
jgi:transposase-like protein